MARRKSNGNLTEAKISVDVGRSNSTFKLSEIDFDKSRDRQALEIGRMVIDAIYDMKEGDK